MANNRHLTLTRDSFIVNNKDSSNALKQYDISDIVLRNFTIRQVSGVTFVDCTLIFDSAFITAEIIETTTFGDGPQRVYVLRELNEDEAKEE